jgi:prolyl-tRNA editing enzyme YbaK/EbsC (Cys-tRNA(Pro) deacylase)
MPPAAARVQERLRERGLDVSVQVLPDSTRTAGEAAVAVGCEVGQIVKSLVFMRGEEPVMVLCAGDRRVASKRLGLRAATADEARAGTGFAIGGIPPLGHDRPLETLIDESLRRYDTVWCGAGSPHAMFEAATEQLIAAIPDGTVVDVAEGP